MRIRRQTIGRYSRDFNVTSHHPLEKVPAESAASAPDNFIQTSGLSIHCLSEVHFFSRLCRTANERTRIHICTRFFGDILRRY